MPSWKKLISSGSSAVLSSLTLDSPLAVAQGGTGAATLTSGYALLGNGTSAPQMINSTADSTMLVGNGSTMVAETGATLRTSIGVDVAGTDNSTDVTLAGSYDYITISGQTITRNQIDLTADVTGLLPDANLSANTAHLDTTQTFSGAKTFSSLASFTMDGNTITGVDDSDEFTDDDAHIMTSAAVQDKILGYSYSTTTGTVTSVGTTGTVNGLTLTGTVTTSGNLTLGGTLAINNGDWSGTDLAVEHGGTGASTFTDGGILFGNGTDAIQASAVLAAGEILIGDGTTEPTILDVGSASGIEILGTIGTGVWNGTEIGLGYGGTELVGETDGKIVVADGNGAPVHLDIGSSTAITILGTIATGVWNGDVIASAYLDADTAHLSGTQTFSGAKTFSSSITLGGHAVDDIDITSEASDADDHLMTAAAIKARIDDLKGVTSNVAGNLIDVSGATGAVTINVDLSELTDGTADVVGSADELVYLDDGTQKRKQIDEIKLGQFNNDQSWSATVGTVTSVTAGTGMTQSGTSTVNPTLNVIGGTCITANADDIAVTADSIGDTQLAYNTGQHLTTSSDVNFNTINVNATTTSANKTSGALIVDGGVGVAENIHAGGDVVAYASSDERLKDNLQVIQDPLDKVGQISGYEFDWNEESPEWAKERGHDIGVIAQEVQKVHPEIVIERTNGYLGVDYKRIIPLLIESIKELKQEVEDLKKKVN